MTWNDRIVLANEPVGLLGPRVSERLAIGPSSWALHEELDLDSRIQMGLQIGRLDPPKFRVAVRKEF